MLDWIRFAITAALLLTGVFFLCMAVLGQYRFHYALNRMHAASMGDSFGLPVCLLALCVSCNDGFTILKFLLVVVFLWCTSPTGSHLLARLQASVDDRLSDHMEVREK